MICPRCSAVTARLGPLRPWAVPAPPRPSPGTAGRELYVGALCRHRCCQLSASLRTAHGPLPSVGEGTRWRSGPREEGRALRGQTAGWAGGGSQQLGREAGPADPRSRTAGSPRHKSPSFTRLRPWKPGLLPSPELTLHGTLPRRLSPQHPSLQRRNEFDKKLSR